MQIGQYNICYTNIIVIKDVIISENVKEEKVLSKSIADTIASAKMAQVSSFSDFARRYN